MLFDIETAPNLGYVWGKFEQNVIEYTSEWYMLAWSAKWHGGRHVTKCLADYDGYTAGSEDDKALVSELHAMLSIADIVIAHNGDRFDVKRSNTRFIEHGLEPPPPYKTVDTCKVARRYFGFNSNKLDDLGHRLGVGRKVKTGGFDLWRGCMHGDPRSWALMKKYNRQDVLLLERVYLKLLPWIGNHPNVSVMRGDPEACRNCGNTQLQKRGFGYTGTGKSQRYQCLKCGAYMRGKHQKQTDIR